MAILVTAFGPFGGREENASSLALRELRKALPEIRTRILPVDSVIAPARLRQALRKIRPTALIMLGEAGGSDGIRLETTAWNLKTFNIPDIAGRMPKEAPVVSGAAASMPSTLPLGEILSALKVGGHCASLSEDPGRYLCNQLFFNALEFLRKDGSAIPAGFIHLPLESDLPTSQAVDAIASIISTVGCAYPIKHRSTKGSLKDSIAPRRDLI